MQSIMFLWNENQDYLCKSQKINEISIRKMKRITPILILIILVFYGCTDEIESIYGDSNLKIINKCNYDLKVYFNDSYIGKLDSDKEYTWSVPSGQHVVKATCTYADDYKKSLYFYSGETTVLVLEVESKYDNFILHSSEIE